MIQYPHAGALKDGSSSDIYEFGIQKLIPSIRTLEIFRLTLAAVLKPRFHLPKKPVSETWIIL